MLKNEGSSKIVIPCSKDFITQVCIHSNMLKIMSVLVVCNFSSVNCREFAIALVQHPPSSTLLLVLLAWTLLLGVAKRSVPCVNGMST